MAEADLVVKAAIEKEMTTLIDHQLALCAY